MDHQSFRFYIPGVSFLFPIFLVACWITVKNYHDSDVRLFVLVGGITAFPTIALPIGWWIYNAYRVWWLILTKGGYENKTFVKLISKDIKPFYSPLNNSILIDFCHIKGIESWIKFDLDIFQKTFYPFTSKAKFKEEIQQKGVHPKFTESLSDFILFKDNGYDYARSISSVRYGIESGIFAIGLGGIYAFGLKAIWLHYLHLSSNYNIFILWVLILSLLSIVLILTLFIRWKYADKEYDARLILTTVTSLDSNFFENSFFADNIPKNVIDNINQLKLTSNSYAAFDLDNTLLIDDIGEAVFAALVKQNLVTDFKWKDYLNLLEKNREAAYKKVIDVMNGLKLNLLKKITHEIIESEDSYIEIEGGKIPIPKPNSIMQSLVSILKSKGIEVFIVTASNKISAEIICWKHFGIPASNVIGAEVETDKNKNISSTVAEIPFAEGKVKALKKRFKEQPIVTGGDGSWDKFLLDYTKSNGIRLWLGQNKDEYQKMKDEFYKDLSFYHIPRE